MEIRSRDRVGLIFSLTVFTLGLTLDARAVPKGSDLGAVGLGRYSTRLPQGRKGPTDLNGNPAHPQVVDGFALAPATHKWWSSVIWRGYPENSKAEVMHALPLSFQAMNGALGIGHSNQGYVARYNEDQAGVKVEDFTFGYAQDLKIDLPGLLQAVPKVEDYSDSTVTIRWGDSRQFLRATLGQGLPFAYFNVNSPKFRISLKDKLRVWHNHGGVLGLTVEGRHYGIFAPAHSLWESPDPKTLESRLNGKDYVSIAILPDDTRETLSLFKKSAYQFVKSGNVDWDYQEDQSRVVTHFRYESKSMEECEGGTGDLLLALAPHQWRNSSVDFTGHSYLSSRGKLRVVRGFEFQTELPFNGVLPELPLVAQDGVDSFKQERLVQHLKEALNESSQNHWGINDSMNMHKFGQAVGRLSRLVRIADQAQLYNERDLLLHDLKDILQRLFDGRSSRSFYYEEVWKSLVGFPDDSDHETQLNEHQISYGYIVQAAATLAQYDPWWSAHGNFGEMVNLIIKDVTNWERKDRRFPFMRNFDFHSGHSWSNGPSLNLNGNYQESSSESMNYATGLILWGAVTHQKAIRDLGVYLYATEASAIEEYWFDVFKENFPNNFGKPALGTLWLNGGSFSARRARPLEDIHALNFFPITGGSLYLGRHPEYLRENQELMRAKGYDPKRMFDIHTSIRAFYDPKGAIDALEENHDYAPDHGESRAHTYYWVHNLNALGRVDQSVTANSATYAVFDQHGSRCYVAYNPEDHKNTIVFSDGVKLSIRPHHLSSYNCISKPSCGPTPVVTAWPTYAPTVVPNGTPTPGMSATPAPTLTIQPSPTVSVSPSVVPSPVATVSPGVQPSPTVTVSPSFTPIPVVTVSPSVLPTPVVTFSPGVQPSPTVTVSPSVRPSPVVTVSPSVQPSPVVTFSPGVQPSPTVTVSPTVRPSPVVTVSPSVQPSPVVTFSPGVQPSPTITVSPTVRPSPVVTVSPSVQPSPVVTFSPGVQPSPTITVSPTVRPSPVVTVSPRIEPSPTVTVNPPILPIPTVSVWPTVLPSPMVTVNPPILPLPSVTASPAATPSFEPIVVITAIPSPTGLPNMMPPLPSPLPIITATAAPVPLPPVPTPGLSPIPSISPTQVPTPQVTASVSPTPTVPSVLPSPVESVNVAPSVVPTPSVSIAPAPNVMPTSTPAPTVSILPSTSPSPKGTPSVTPHLPGQPQDFSHRLELDYSGKITIVILPSQPEAFEITQIRYRIDKEPHHRSSKMNLDKHQHWRIVINGLGPDGVLDYSFTYKIGNQVFDTEWFQFSY